MQTIVLEQHNCCAVSLCKSFWSPNLCLQQTQQKKKKSCRGLSYVMPFDSTHKLIRHLLTSRACRRKVLFSALAHSMHSRHSSTSCPVAASMSRKRSSRERTSRAALALLMEMRKGLTNFRRPPSSGWHTKTSHRISLIRLFKSCVSTGWTTKFDLITCSLSGLSQERPQLQDALFFNPDSFLIVLLNISPHCLKKTTTWSQNPVHYLSSTKSPLWDIHSTGVSPRLLSFGNHDWFPVSQFLMSHDLVYLHELNISHSYQSDFCKNKTCRSDVSGAECEV